MTKSFGFGAILDLGSAGAFILARQPEIAVAAALQAGKETSTV